MVQKHISRFGFVAPRPSRSRPKATRGPRTVRPGHSRQENREPGKIHEEAPAPVQTGGTTKRVDQPAILRACTQLFEKAIAEAQDLCKERWLRCRGFIHIFTSSRESRRNLCTWRTTRTTRRFICRTEIAKNPREPKKAAATSEQNPRVGKEPVVFAF